MAQYTVSCSEDLFIYIFESKPRNILGGTFYLMVHQSFIGIKYLVMKVPATREESSLIMNTLCDNTLCNPSMLWQGYKEIGRIQ